MKFLPFESFSYPFFDFTYKADFPMLVNSFLNPLQIQNDQLGRKGLYIHIPFCDTICSFCPFVKSTGSDDRIESYVNALLNELRILASTQKISSWTLDAVYIGGGTPSLLSERQIDTLVKTIRANFHLADPCEITFEMEAKSVTQEKLFCLKEIGVNRVSFGLQTFDKDIRPYLNLTATERQLRETIALFSEIFPDKNNMDVLVGLPGQTYESMYRDLKRVADSGISSVSIYPMDYVMTLPAFLNRIHHREIPPPPDAPTRNEMFYAARIFLRSCFREYNIYSYGNDITSPCSYMFRIVYGGYADEYIGSGVGAYSYLRGITYQNLLNEKEYIRTVLKGQIPVRVASPYQAYERGLVFFPKRMMYDWSELSKLGLKEIYEDRISKLIDEGFLSVDNDGISLTPLGEKFYGSLMVEFFSDTQRRIYSRICNKLEDQLGWTGTSQVPNHKPSSKSVGAVTVMSPLKQKA